MKKVSAISFLMLCLNFVDAQKHDYQWLFGYGNEVPTDTDFVGVTLNFNDSISTIHQHRRLADFTGDNMSYCDGNGNLLFYSNGADVFDKRDSVMLNGDSLNLGYDWLNEIFESDYRYTGLVQTAGLLALPAPGDSTKAYICHYDVQLVSLPAVPEDYPCDSSFYTKIDLNGNSGNGEVIIKNQTISNDTLSHDCFSAVQHGNGRDWWVIHPYWQGSNCYYEFLLTDTGMGLYRKQCIGNDRLHDGALGQSCFSPDGSKYFWVTAADSIRMFDFDRCTGLLSNPQIIPFPFPSFGDSMGLVGGIAVSPNNRFLYVAGAKLLLQYDLLASDIGVSVDTVGIWDQFFDPYPYVTTFFLAQLGPDGKIYIAGFNSTRHLSVINHPDLKGDSCLFTQHSLYLQTYSAASMPTFPNYRQGALKNSECDTLSTMAEDIRANKEQILKVFPNPASDYVVVDYGFTDWNKGQVSLEICNTLGQVFYLQQVPMYSGYQKIDVSAFASGMYTAFIKRGGGVVATAKFVKE